MHKNVGFLIFNTICPIFCVKVKKNVEHEHRKVYDVKIYDYKGRKNLCGCRIKETRVRQHMTQAALAAKLQVAGLAIERDSISRIEIGTRFVTDYELALLAKVLGVSMEWLTEQERSEKR